MRMMIATVIQKIYSYVFENDEEDYEEEGEVDLEE
jgi:hypothetical protein